MSEKACAFCGDSLTQFGEGHKCKDRTTGKVVYLCCACFDDEIKEVAGALQSLIGKKAS